MDEKWDSLRLFLMVLWVVVLVGVPMVLLPSVGRRIVVSVLVLLHFGGILTATTAVSTINGTTPWLPSYVWVKFYRYYLQFAYLNNAYHFYSPEPGPPTLIWFKLEFEGDVPPYWLRLSNRDECPTRLQYQRLLALTESVGPNNTVNTSPSKLQVLAARLSTAITIHDNEARRKGERIYDWPREYFFGDLPNRYRAPSELAKKYLRSYVRHVALTVRPREHPDAKVKRIKVYRLVHQIIAANQLADGLNPLDPTMYYATFLGDYDAAGELIYKPLGPKDAKTIEWWDQDFQTGREQLMSEPAQDPFLYWYLPIRRIPKDPDTTPKNVEDTILLDALSIHAGSPPWQDK
jgi:hypothetical protein